MLNFFRPKEHKPYISAVILCAGNSSRMGDGINKQLVIINDMPVIMHSIMAFENCVDIDEIVLVCKEDMIPDLNAMVKEYGCGKVTTIVQGGDVRTRSSKIGVESTSEKSQYVLIHDGARPLVTRELISLVVQAAVEYGAAAPSTSIFETVKHVDSDGFVTETLNRQNLRTIQTPQGFSKNVYLSAFLRGSDDVDLFDDCQLIELYGGKVKLVDGSRDNIKITTLEDINTVRNILENI